MNEPLLFFITSIVAIVAAALVIIQRHPVYSALYLVVTFCALALLYVLLAAPFIAMVQIIVYAGAIMVLFLFIIFLLNLDRPLETQNKLKHQWLVATALTAVLALEGAHLLARGLPTTSLSEARELTGDFGTIQQIGRALFDQPLVFAFEATSLILLAAMLGVVVLAKRRVD